MRMLSHLDWIFSSGDLDIVPLWSLDPDLLEIEIFGEQQPVFHARAYASAHVTLNQLVHCDRLLASDRRRIHL